MQLHGEVTTSQPDSEDDEADDGKYVGVGSDEDEQRPAVRLQHARVQRRSTSSSMGGGPPAAALDRLASSLRRVERGGLRYMQDLATQVGGGGASTPLAQLLLLFA